MTLNYKASNEEERIVQIGETEAGRILTVVSTWRGSKIRVITASPADRALRKFYLDQGKEIMEKEFKIPEFATEAQEAKWWEDNQQQLAERFVQAAAKGTLGRGTVVRRGATPTTTIRLDPDDITKARAQAERRGLRYQTYLKMILHEALQRGVDSGQA